MVNKTFCSVFGCKSNKEKDKELSFHLFPKPKRQIVKILNKFGAVEQIDGRDAWIRSLKMGKKASNYMRICSKHFKESDYYEIGETNHALRRRLKPTAVPSCNLPERSHDPKSPVKKSLALVASQRSVRISRRRLNHTCQENKGDLPSTRTTDDIAAAQALLDLFSQKEEESATTPVNIFSPVPHPPSSHFVYGTEEMDTTAISPAQVHAPLMVDEATTVKSGDLYTPFIERLDSEEKLNMFTGIPSFELLDIIVEQLSKIVLDRRQHRLSLRERVIFALMKLKLNLSYGVLSVLFGTLSPQYAGTLFKEVIVALSVVLRPAVPWPGREEISRNRPKCFVNYPLARIVLDCTEVAVQRPKCLPCRLKLYSHYKGGFTIKWMTGVSPSGLITFVSKPYGGSASDSKIFAQSGILQKLEKDDCIMVDKGFLVDVPCYENGINIIRPSFLRNKDKFTKEEALNNRSISKARVHVERANAKIKVNKFFSNKIEIVHLGIVDEAFIVACALANLKAPLMAPNKF